MDQFEREALDVVYQDFIKINNDIAAEERVDAFIAGVEAAASKGYILRDEPVLVQGLPEAQELYKEAVRELAEDQAISLAGSASLAGVSAVLVGALATPAVAAVAAPLVLCGVLGIAFGAANTASRHLKERVKALKAVK